MNKGSMKSAPSAKQAGFTLVEIAIVLVIIGLLLGGILKGQEMINQAKIKNLINDFNGLAAAMYSYQDRYRALPGDELNANTTARWNGAFGGDGNGTFNRTTPAVVTGAYNTTAAVPAANSSESLLFWLHLRLAGFVPGATDLTLAASTQQPNNSVNGIVGVQTAGLDFSSNIICTSNLPDKIAIAVDTQLDDGAAKTGQVRAQLQTGPNPAAAAATAAAPFAYAENGINQYLVCKNL
jgi:prepilin-type N-terminal cleavage/methylation domain-containing protein